MNDEDLVSRIAVDPAIQEGKPVIRGTRVPVERIVGTLSAGASYVELREDYGIEYEHVRAAVAYAAKAASSDDATDL